MKIGDSVKAHFPGETMWTVVEHIVDDGFIGRLDNHPVCTGRHGCKLGDKIYCKHDTDLRCGYIATAKLTEIGEL